MDNTGASVRVFVQHLEGNLKHELRLTALELASLDLLITAAQQRGLSVSDRVAKTVDQADVHAAHAEAHAKGIELSAHDRRIFQQIRELASQLETAPTLGELLDARAAVVRQIQQRQSG
jgi:hypothetical protein